VVVKPKFLFIFRGKRRESVPVSIHKDIEKKLNTVRAFMIRNFGTKLKTPRKSHYKKDEVAFDAFKKTS
jgi:transposase